MQKKYCSINLPFPVSFYGNFFHFLRLAPATSGRLAHYGHIASVASGRLVALRLPQVEKVEKKGFQKITRDFVVTLWRAAARG